MTIVSLITVLVVPLPGTRVGDVIASEVLLMRDCYIQIAPGSRLFTYLAYVKLYVFMTN